MNDYTESVESIASAARVASVTMRKATTAQKNEALEAIAAALCENAAQIEEANAEDYERERAGGMSQGLLDRLFLDSERIADIAEAVRHVASLPDPIGDVIKGRTLDNGMRLTQVRVPIGVIGMIYEARPNVTVDAASLALKAGSAAILRGGSAAARTNSVLVDIMRTAIASCGLPSDAISSIDSFGREGAVALMRARGLVDLVIPRGGAGLIRTVVEQSLVPVIETGVGNCHVYVDSSADLDKAHAITINSKTQRVGVCNAAETLLVHGDVAEDFLPGALSSLSEAGVVLHADERTRELAPEGVEIVDATEDDWEREYLALEMAVRVVPDLDSALEHIRTYSTGHTEAIVAQDCDAIEEFVNGLDCAAVMVNASTRFTDGGQFGLGAEIGISTQKLHARGPMGLDEITTTMWIARGDGHIRS
ncbi:MAG: glutamate-5-semialdehyde dehydrogenase [Actinomycetaceae bacterium]|nr:glutamate-5-semialdehyde dehydrogenase [Actinomycetaceae bacterium]